MIIGRVFGRTLSRRSGLAPCRHAPIMNDSGVVDPRDEKFVARLATDNDSVRNDFGEQAQMLLGRLGAVLSAHCAYVGGVRGGVLGDGSRLRTVPEESVRVLHFGAPLEKFRGVHVQSQPSALG